MKHLHFKLFIIIVTVLFALWGCDGKNFTPNDDSDTPEPDENPIPVLTAISPSWCVARIPAFEMTVEGNDFVEGATIVFRGNEMDTTFVDSNHLTCVIQPDDTLLSSSAQAGHYDREVGSAQATNALVKVRNPSLGGGDSNTVDFSICENYTFSEPGEIQWTDKYLDWISSMFVEPEGRIDLVYQHDEYPENPEFLNLIYLRQSIDGGKSWSDPSQITKNPAYFPYGSRFMVDSAGIMHSAHCRVTGRVYYHQSTDNGHHWTKPVELDYEILPESLCNWSTSFRMDVDPAGVIHVLIRDYFVETAQGNIMYARSEDNGAHWSFRHMSYLGDDPSIACDGIDRVYAVWMHPKERSANSELYIAFRSSNDGGFTWSDMQVMRGDSLYNYNKNIRMAVNRENHHVYLVYSYKNSPVKNRYRVYFRRSTDFGNTWSTPIVLTPAGEWSDSGQVVVDSAGNINVFYKRQNYVYSRLSTDGGLSWTTEAPLTPAMQTASPYYNVGIDENGHISVVTNYFVHGQQASFYYRGVPYTFDLR
jgi:hypothetical protein